MHNKNLSQKPFSNEKLRIMEQYLYRKNSRLEAFDKRNEDCKIVSEIAEKLKISKTISEIAYCTSLLTLYISSSLENEVEILKMLKKITSSRQLQS